MKTIAVSEKASFWKLDNLNASILAFDKIFIPQGLDHVGREMLEVDLLNKCITIQDVEYLESKGIVEQNPVSMKASKILERAIGDIRNYNHKFGVIDSNTRLVFGNILERLLIEELSKESSDIFVPSSSIALNLPQRAIKKQVNVITAIIENLPIISDEVPLDEVISFKQENSSDYRKLMVWASNQNEDSNVKESKEELYDMIQNFRRYAEIGELKFKSGTIEFMFQAAGLFKDALKLDFGKVSNTLATIRQSKADLFLHEVNNPQLPLKYIVKAQDNFK